MAARRREPVIPCGRLVGRPSNQIWFRLSDVLTADFYALVGPVLAVRLSVAMPSLRDTLAVATHEVHLHTRLSDWRRNIMDVSLDREERHVL